MKIYFMKFLYFVSGNRLCQAMLSRIFRLVRLLMGFGSGAFPDQSGEKKLLLKLNQGTGERDAPLVFFDVGANQGQFLNLIVDIFSKEDIRVYSFEPASSSFASLQKKFGNSTNVTLENLGLDDHPNRSKLYYDEPNSLFASKYDRDVSRLNTKFEHSELAEFTTLDLYYENKNVEEIFLLKIDVEGNELNVLKGAKGLFEQKRIRYLCFEFGSTQIDSRTFFKDIYAFLKDFQMIGLYRILPNGYLSPVAQYDEKLEQFFTSNYFAVMK